MRILVADDDAITRDVLSHVLERWGHEVIAVSDGREAMSVLTGDRRPSMAILDWLMPNMNGVDVCRALRSEQSDYYTYVVLLTVKKRESDFVEGMESGADNYLTKPFDVKDLQSVIDAGICVVASGPGRSRDGDLPCINEDGSYCHE